MDIKKAILIVLLLFFFNSYAQVFGNLSGKVSNSIGDPIIGASVFLENTTQGSQTDSDGNYSITNITPGSYNLIVSYIGYKTQTKFNIIVKSKGTLDYNFVLIEASQNLQTVIISNANRISKPKETPLSTQSLSATEIATYPGSNNDVVQVAQTLPGVSPSVGGFRNDLIIRGGAPNETVYYLDGIEVPNINHFATQGSAGGPVGLINVSFIEEVTLSTSAFGAQFDNPLSGVLQFNQRNGNNKQFRGNFRVSASEAALTFEGPLFKKEKTESNTTFLASVRRSYLQFLFEAIGLPIRPDYWDYQYKFNHIINDYNSISITGVGSIDDFTVEPLDEFDAEQQAQLEQAPFIEQQTNAIGITWKHRFKNGNGFTQTSLSNNILNNEFTRFEDAVNETGVIFNNDATEAETKLRYQLTTFFSNWKLAAGANIQYSNYKNETVNFTDDIAFNTEIDFIKYGVFANVTNSFFSNKLDISLGFRLDDDTFTDEDNLLSTFSPRASLSYEFKENWRLNGSLGRYFKIPIYTVLGFRDNNNNLVNQDTNYTQSDHYVIGLEHYFSPSSIISVEGFYKYYKRFPVSVVDQVSLANQGAGFEVLGSEDVITNGRGRSYGTEFQFQQKFSNNFYGTFAYTFFFSEFTNSDRNVFVPSVLDSRHLISFAGGYKLNRNWEISARYRFAGETPFISVDQVATLENFPDVMLDFGRLGEGKLNTFSQLDIRIDKKWNFKKLSLDVFIEAQNVLGQQIPQPTEFGLNRTIDGTIINPRSLVPIEQDSGTIIPSIGVVVDF